MNLHLLIFSALAEWSTEGLGKDDNAVAAMEPTPPPVLKNNFQCLGTSCCTHPVCASLKERALCRQWYFLRWVSIGPLMPSEMLKELRERLEGRKFRFCATSTVTGVFNILLKVEPGDFTGWSRYLVPTPLASVFQAGHCRVWQLKCCWDAFECDVQIWFAALTETDDRTVFGDRRLSCDLLDETRLAGVGG
ncbi:hypothetical protein VFPBJ_11755 [Purpureocillium lilacinum]|uniref:Uncharacterized protein n=1 Tax=Purpureocillium lilacinum TaxID=33203 RepID=A0A179EW24_PURLI|nr:hypothetical protein VFPBJ_11755 [Purpureocillium lilacinum]